MVGSLLRGRSMTLEKEKWLFSILFHYFYVGHTHIHRKKEQEKGRLQKDQWASGYCKITSMNKVTTHLDCTLLSWPLTLNPMPYCCLHLQNLKVSMATTWTVKKGGICSNAAPQKHHAHPKNKQNKTQKTKQKSQQHFLHTTHSPSNINFKATM